MGAEKIMIRHTSKVRDEIGLQNTEEKDKQFLIEKIIAKTEIKNPYTIETEKEPKTMLEVEKIYRIYSRVYQTLSYEIAETFIQYINTLTADEIKQLDADLRSNGWGVKSIAEIEDYIELFRLFQLFYYLNGRLPLTKGLLPTPYGELPDGSEKISLKTLYEMFKDTKYLGLTSIQFLSALNLFFGGDVLLSKDTMTELYKNLSLRTLSGEKQIEFDKISDLTAHMNFKMKHSILANMDDQDKATKTNNENVRDTFEFLKKPSDEDNFEREL